MRRSASSPGKMIGREGEDAAESVRAITTLRRRMTVVMYVVIFLYAAAFWIQVGAMPVRETPSLTNHFCLTHFLTSFLCSVSLQEVGGGPCNVWLHGDAVCCGHAAGGTAVWPLWGSLWRQSSSPARLPLLLPDLPHPGNGGQYHSPVHLPTLCVHDARHAWYLRLNPS